jgi:hypothetical protein
VARLDSGGVTPEHLIAFIDGEAPPLIAARIRASPTLSATADGYAKTQWALQQRLSRFACPSPHQLGEFALDLLAPQERTRVAAHLIACPRCTTELQTLRAFLGESAERSIGVAERMRRIVATLVSPPSSMRAAVRGMGEVAPRSYRAADVTITLDVVAGKGQETVTILGLVWQEHAEPDALAGGLVRLYAGDDLLQTTAIDDLATFTFTNVATETYQMEVTLDTLQIAIEGLRLDS